MSHACSHAVSAFLRTSDRKIGRWNQQVLASPTGCFHWTSGRDRYFFHESIDHRGLRGAIPYTRCLCDAWDKLQDNVSNQGTKKQGGREPQFTEHGCETEHEKSQWVVLQILVRNTNLKWRECSRNRQHNMFGCVVLF